MSRQPSRTGRGRGTGKKLTAAQLRSRKLDEDYSSRRRVVQPLVSFVIPRRRHPSSASKLNRYFDYLFGQYGATRGVKIPVRRKDPDRLEKLKERFGQGREQGGLPGIKYVFVPTYYRKGTDDMIRPIIRHRKTGPDVIVYREEAIDDEGARHVLHEVTTQYLPFDKEAMARDAGAEVERVGAELMESLGITDHRDVRFRVQNGSSQMADMLPLDTMAAQVQFLIGRYSKEDGHHWTTWLDGLTIEASGQQASLKEYGIAKRGEMRRRKAIGKVNLEHTNLLRAIEQSRRGAMTEVLTMATRGNVSDAPHVKKVLTGMRTAGLVTGDDSHWILTRKGADYLSNARHILPLFGL